jgi:hypothetical protein
LDGEWHLAGLCARHGWAFAAYDEAGALCAAAKGRPPAWADGIYGAELWGLFMAASVADPWAPLRVDCLSVQQGAQMGQEWAGAPVRYLARAWAPLSAALDDDPQRVVWMPAHCSQQAVGVKKLSNGELLTALDLAGNSLVDQLAKEAARADRLPWARREEVRRLGERLTDVATWIGQITELANRFPDPHWPGLGKQQFFRDSDGAARKTAATSRSWQRVARQQSACHSGSPPGQASKLDCMARHPRWNEIRRRVRARQQAQSLLPPPLSVDRSSLATLQVECGSGSSRSSGALATRLCRKRKRLALGPSSPSGGRRLRCRLANTCLPQQAVFENVGVAMGGCAKPHRLKQGTVHVERCRPAEPALEVLQELHDSGLKVAWPRSSRVQAAPDVPEEHCAHMLVNDGSLTPTSRMPMSSSETQAAVAELEELERCGLRVARPW